MNQVMRPESAESAAGTAAASAETASSDPSQRPQIEDGSHVVPVGGAAAASQPVDEHVLSSAAQ